jgi:hypothetical protein
MGEREKQVPRPGNRALWSVFDPFYSAEPPNLLSLGGQFPLSQRERAGVRENRSTENPVSVYGKGERLVTLSPIGGEGGVRGRESQLKSIT